MQNQETKKIKLVRKLALILVAAGLITGLGFIIATKSQNNIKTLTINGSLSASSIKFRRSVGTRLLAPIGPPNIDTANGYATCRSYAGIKNCYPRGYGTASNSPTAQEINTSGGTAELINFPAYLYFAKPYLLDDGAKKYNSSYIAPPRL